MEMERREFLKLGAGALTFSLAAESVWAQTNKIEVHWLGQSTTKITTLTGKVIVIDPFMVNNPKTPPGWKNLDALGKGGKVQPAGPQITITQTRAEHSSEVTVTDPATKKSTTYPGGEPPGFIVEMENGFKLYHMGDTGLFGDMTLIGSYYKPDLIMIPIGGHFVMD